MRVLITGAGSRLGPELLAAFADDDTVGLSRQDLDVTNEAAVVAAVGDHAPDLVVHAAALTDAKECDRDPDTAWRVNAAGTWWVARACELAGTAMVYLSCADVFDGGADRPYTEFDRPTPASLYGRSKEAGEQLVRQTLFAHYIIRTSWLLGPQRDDFAGRVLRSAREQGVVRITEGDRRVDPAFSFDLAPAIRHVAASGRHGTYHLTNAGSCTWREVNEALLAHAGLPVAVEDVSATASEGLTPPAHTSVLGSVSARLAGLPALPHWRLSLKRLARRIADMGSAQLGHNQLGHNRS